jgi:hypothetical protein
MGQVLSTIIALNTKVISYLSRIYDPNLILTIEDSDSD